MRRLAISGALMLAACGSPQAATPVSTGQVDRIVVEKAAHRLTLYVDPQVVRTYRVSLGRGGLAPKSREGDRLTPEGDYKITGRNPRSAYHLSLRVSYPTAEQAQAARARGLAPGGDIMIHGLPNGRGHLFALFKGQDWTDGCIAVSDPEIEEIWRLVRDGASVHIQP